MNIRFHRQDLPDLSNYDVEAIATPARPAAVAMPVATPAVEAGASPPPTFSR